jgi:hypothetical protein
MRKGRDETFSASVDHGDDGVGINLAVVAVVHEANEHRVHVPPGLDGVKTADDDVELSVKIIVLVFNAAEVAADTGASHNVSKVVNSRAS